MSLRSDVETFFRGRRLPKAHGEAVARAIDIEAERRQEPGCAHWCFTFLTVTNAAARDLNMERLRQEFPAAYNRLEADGVPGDEKAGGGQLVFERGMRVRLTRNLDKDCGFVNGALCTMEDVLNRCTSGI